MFCYPKSRIDENGGKLQLKLEQRNAVEYLLNHDDVLAILPTRYHISLIFQFFAVAASFESKEPETVLVVCPLKSIIEDQIAEAKSMGIPAASRRKMSCVLPYFS